MQDLLDTITAEMGDQRLSSLAAGLGLGQDQAQQAVAAALPLLTEGLAQNASSPEGAQALADALERDHSNPLQEAVGGLGGIAGLLGGGGGGAGGLGGLGALAGALGAGGASKALQGSGILGHIFGANQQKVEGGLAEATGLSSGVIAKLLPVLAPIVMSALGTKKKSSGLDAQGLASYLGEQSGGQKGLLDGLLGGGAGGGTDLAALGSGLVQSGVLNKLFQ